MNCLNPVPALLVTYFPAWLEERVASIDSLPVEGCDFEEPVVLWRTFPSFPDFLHPLWHQTDEETKKWPQICPWSCSSVEIWNCRATLFYTYSLAGTWIIPKKIIMSKNMCKFQLRGQTACIDWCYWQSRWSWRKVRTSSVVSILGPTGCFGSNFAFGGSRARSSVLPPSHPDVARFGRWSLCWPRGRGSPWSARHGPRGSRTRTCLTCRWRRCTPRLLLHHPPCGNREIDVEDSNLLWFIKITHSNELWSCIKLWLHKSSWI